MGQQQLIILVLGAIIVGLAVYGGLQLMHSYNQSNEQDLILQQMNSVLAEARSYALKTRSLGGGEGSFIGFSPPKNLTNTARVTIYTTVGADWILFQGYGSIEGIDGTNPVQIIAQYSRSALDNDDAGELTPLSMLLTT